MRKTIVCVAVLISSIVGVHVAGSAAQTKASRDEATKAIRAAVYQMMKAALTSDAETFKRHAAKRTLDLINLVYEAAQRDPRFQKELQAARISSADQFLGYFLQGMATQFLQVGPLSPEAAARRVASDSTISFVSDTQAKIIAGNLGAARARFAGKQWKIDLTDLFKKPVLEEIKDPDLRARIKNL